MANNVVDGTFRNNVGVNNILYAYVIYKGRANNVVDGGFRNNIGVNNKTEA